METRVAGGVLQIDRLGAFGHQPDQPLPLFRVTWQTISAFRPSLATNTNQPLSRLRK